MALTLTGSLSISGSLVVDDIPVVLSNETSSLSVATASYAQTASTAVNFSVSCNLAVGSGSCAAGIFSSVAGGVSNCASGNCSFVGGGQCNLATGSYSTVLSGLCNKACNLQYGYSLVVSGLKNTSSGNYSVVLHGCQNSVSGFYTSILNGKNNLITGSGIYNAAYSTIVGGSFNRICTNQEGGSFIGGGIYNCTLQGFGTIGGGNQNVLSCYSFIGGGLCNLAFCWSTISGGCNNKNCGCFSSIGGGDNNRITANHATVAGGVNNYTSGRYSVIGGGQCNCLLNDCWSTISGGYCNYISGSGNSYSTYGNTISGGYCNTIKINTVSGYNYAWCPKNSTIAGGYGNVMTSCISFIGSGYENCMEWGGGNVIGGGFRNSNSGWYAFIGAGGSNCICICSNNSAILAGYGNCVGRMNEGLLLGGANNLLDCWQSACSLIGTGNRNCILSGPSFTWPACHSTLLNGCCNKILYNQYGFIGTGINNCIHAGSHNTLISGVSNCICYGNYNFFGNGCLNKVDNSDYISIVGGSNNSGYSDYAFIGGGQCNLIDGEISCQIGSLNCARVDYNTIQLGAVSCSFAPAIFTSIFIKGINATSSVSSNMTGYFVRHNGTCSSFTASSDQYSNCLFPVGPLRCVDLSASVACIVSTTDYTSCFTPGQSIYFSCDGGSFFSRPVVSTAFCTTYTCVQTNGTLVGTPTPGYSTYTCIPVTQIGVSSFSPTLSYNDACYGQTFINTTKAFCVDGGNYTSSFASGQTAYFRTSAGDRYYFQVDSSCFSSSYTYVNVCNTYTASFFPQGAGSLFVVCGVDKPYSNIVGGKFNTASAAFSFVGGGCCNVVSGSCSTILNGFCNFNAGTGSFIAGGCCNIITGANTRIGSAILSGCCNYIGCHTANNGNSTISGYCNCIDFVASSAIY